MTTPFTKAAVLEILRTPAASDTFPDMIARVEALEPVAQPETPTPGRRIRLSELDAFEPDCLRCEDGWVCENHPAKAWPTQCDCGAGMPCECNPIGSAGEQPTPGQFTTMCLAIEDVVTGRGFDVAIPDAVKAYLRNALMVGGWRGERE